MYIFESEQAIVLSVDRCGHIIHPSKPCRLFHLIYYRATTCLLNSNPEYWRT